MKTKPINAYAETKSIVTGILNIVDFVEESCCGIDDGGEIKMSVEKLCDGLYLCSAYEVNPLMKHLSSLSQGG